MTGGQALERCTDCAHVQYPARGFCERCLSPSTDVGPVGDAGTLLSWSTLHASLNQRLRPYLPLTVASIELDSGPVVMAYFSGLPNKAGQPVRIATVPDPSGTPVLLARARDDTTSPENLF